MRSRILRYDELRDPLRVPSETRTLAVHISNVTDLGDGTAKVVIEEPFVGEIFEKIRVGETLVDYAGREFPILEIVAGEQPNGYTTLGSSVDWLREQEETRKGLIVNTSVQSGNFILPLVSGIPISENPIGNSPGEDDDGINTTYVYTLAFTLAYNPITVTWRELDGLEEVSKSGEILPNGTISGDLQTGSYTDFNTQVVVYTATPAVANSVNVAYTALYDKPDGLVTPMGGPPTTGLVGETYSFFGNIVPIPAGYVRVYWTDPAQHIGYFDPDGVPHGDLLGAPNTSYTGSSINRETGEIVIAASSAVTTSSILVIYDGAKVRPSHLLGYLAQDYGVELDRDQPEERQRSFVYNAQSVFDLKGTVDGYRVMGALHGYNVTSRSLYRLSYENYLNAIEDRRYILGATEDIKPNDQNHDPDTDEPTVNISTDGPPYICTLTPQVPEGFILVVWSEGGQEMFGYFDYDGVPHGELGPLSSVDRATGATLIDTVAVADGESIVVSPGAWFYTDIPPSRLMFDEIAADAVPLDTYCWDGEFPVYSQNPVTVTKVTADGADGDDECYLVEVTVTSPEFTFGTDGSLIGSSTWRILEYTRTGNTTCTLRVAGQSTPSLSAMTIEWSAFYFPVTIVSPPIAPAPLLLGPGGNGSGNRYRVNVQGNPTLSGLPPISGAGNWTLLDQLQQHAIVESFEDHGTYLTFELVADQAPPIGDANFYYACEVVPSCDYCRASFVLLFVDQDPSDRAKEKIERALGQMVPAHVKVAFHYTDNSDSGAYTGSQVFLFGASDGVGATSSVYMWDESTEAWSIKANIAYNSLNHARTSHACIAPDGRLFPVVIAGIGPSEGSLVAPPDGTGDSVSETAGSKVLTYNHSTNSWILVGDIPVVPV